MPARLDDLRLTTERMDLRPFDRERDWAHFVTDIVSDASVSGPWPDEADPSLTVHDRVRRAAQEFLPWFDEGRARGLVAWTLRTRSGEFIGVSGLMTSEPPVGGPDPEFGCLLAARWHGSGLATEAGHAVLADAWERLGLDRVITVMDLPKPASRRLIDKLGFRFDDVAFGDDGHPYLVFVVDRPRSR